jgi:hypothetical protein
MSNMVMLGMAIRALVRQAATCPLNVKFSTNLKGLSQMDFAETDWPMHIQ